MATAIKSFRGAHAFLSNFYPCSIIVYGFKFPSVEHAYQAQKGPRFQWNSFHGISAGEAKRLGRRMAVRDDWDEVKLDIMLDLLKIKFSDDNLKGKLLETGNAELIEGNTWGDTYWGVCNGVGENHLGKLLMKVRKG